MELDFWDADGILLINYLKKEKTITWEYCACPFDRLKTAVAEKRLEITKKMVFFLYDNAPVHSSHVA